MEPTSITRPSHTTTLLDELRFTETTDQLIQFFTIVQCRQTEFNTLLETKIIDLLHNFAYRGLSDAQKNRLLKVSSEAQKILGIHRFGKIHQEVVAMCNVAPYVPLNDQNLGDAIQSGISSPTIKVDTSALHFKDAINHIPIEEIIENYDLLIHRFKFTVHDIINNSTVGRMLTASIQMKNKTIQDLCLDYLDRTFKLHLNMQINQLMILALDWELVPTEIIDHVAGSVNSIVMHLKGEVDKEKAQRLFSRVGPKVTNLCFKESPITDELLTLIVELCPNLNRLNISSPSITSAGLATLPALKQFRQLELLCPNVAYLPAFPNRINLTLYPQDNFDFNSIFLSTVSFLQIYDCTLDDLSSFDKAGSTIILFQNVVLSDAAKRQACKMKIAKGVDLRGLSIDLIPDHVLESVILEIDEHVLETHILQIVDPELMHRFKKYPRSPTLRKLLPLFAKKCPKEYAQQYWKVGFHELINSLFPPTAPENLPMHPIKCVPEVGHLLKIQSATLKTLVEPYAVLEALRDHKMIKNLYIIFTDSAGIDQSGLGRQFITQLFEGLIQRSSTHLKFVQHQQEGYLPEVSQNPDSGTIADLETIGRMIAFSAHNNRKFPIGEIFHPLFYQVLMSLQESDLSVLTFNRLMDLYGILHQNNREYQLFKSLLSKNAGTLLSTDQQNFLDALWIEHSDVLTDDLQNEIRNHVTGMLNAHILPIQAIARGIHQSLPFHIRGMRLSKWNDYFYPWNNPMDFKLQVEGELTKELFLQKVKISIYNLPEITLSEEEKRIQDEEIARFRSWIEEWVDRHSIAELRNVLLAITSARNLSVNISFRLIETDGINAHTCFGEVDIHRYFTKEELMREMDDWGAGKGIRTISRS